MAPLEVNVLRRLAGVKKLEPEGGWFRIRAGKNSTSQGLHRILIVDDNPREREAIRNLLLGSAGASHYLVQESGSAEEGLARCISEYFDCVLLDGGLPDSACGEFVQRLKGRRGAAGGPPVVVLADPGCEAAALQAVEQGAQACLNRTGITRGRIIHALQTAMEKTLLLRRVRGLQDDLERQRALLQEAERRQDEFLAMLAHELRNPLVPLLNAAYIVGELELLEPRLRWVQGIIKNQITHLSRLVDDLLDVSRIAQGKIVLEIETLDVVEVLNRAVETVKPLAQHKRVELAIHAPGVPVWMDGDTVRLTQVLVNLLDNAAKYTLEGGKVEVFLNVAWEEVEIQVRDNGIGIPADLLPHIFDLFRQGEQALDRSQGGLGLGLTLVKRLVDMLGGRVMAFSEGPGRGSTFAIRMPLYADQPPKEDVQEGLCGGYMVSSA